MLLEHKMHLESLEQSHAAHLKGVQDDYLTKVEASESRFHAAVEEFPSSLQVSPYFVILNRKTK